MEVLPLSLLETRDQLIALYWVIMYLGWAGGEVLDCPDQEIASGVRMYSLKKP